MEILNIDNVTVRVCVATYELGSIYIVINN